MPGGRSCGLWPPLIPLHYQRQTLDHFHWDHRSFKLFCGQIYSRQAAAYHHTCSVPTSLSSLNYCFPVGVLSLSLSLSISLWRLSACSDSLRCAAALQSPSRGIASPGKWHWLPIILSAKWHSTGSLSSAMFERSWSSYNCNYILAWTIIIISRGHLTYGSVCH